MADLTRRIGLSLGADICWPICFEDILKELDLAIPMDGDTVRFEVDRVTIEPFDLRQPVHYDVVIDRLTHWYNTSREWIKKAVVLDGVYVFNNPWSVQSMEKMTTYCAMMRLGMPIPETMLLPPKEYSDYSPDLRRTLESYARYFDLGDIGAKLGYPMFMKPYDGGGWVGVSRIDKQEQLEQSYEESGKFVMHLQKGVDPYERFVRGIGLGPQVKIVDYEPSAPLHERYQPGLDVVAGADQKLIQDTVMTINAFFGWDFNSCELLLKDGVWYPIDFANPCPDSQVTSLHIHFPWVVIANLRWALFCAATKRPFRPNLDWKPFFDIAAKDLPYREKLKRYARLAERRLQKKEFDAFCKEHLPHLDRVAWDYFGDERAHAAVRKKVEVLFPDHEWDEFTEKFWGAIQSWREQTKGSMTA